MTESQKEELCLLAPLIFLCLCGFAFLGFMVWEHHQTGSRVVVKTEFKEYEVVGINPPKHFYLDLKDKKTGHLFNHVYVSKHCNNWRNLKLGSVYSFKEVIYKFEKKPERYVKIETGGSDFCHNL